MKNQNSPLECGMLNLVQNKVYFPLQQVKNKPHEGITNVCLFLGLLAWLQIVLICKM
jgi:hypothetical protein